MLSTFGNQVYNHTFVFPKIHIICTHPTYKYGVEIFITYLGHHNEYHQLGRMKRKGGKYEKVKNY